VRAVLEAYAVTGALGLARRDGNRRYYDLIERLLPSDALAREVPLSAYIRFAGATSLEWAPHLRMEQRLFLTRP
jgi:uncharacterized protein YcaQ